MSCDVGKVTSQLILQPFHRFTYVTAHSLTLPSLLLRHSSFSNPSVGEVTSQLILQPFRRFTYVTAHSQTLPSFHLRYSSFSNPSVGEVTSQLILQPFRRFTYVTVHSPTLPLLQLRHTHSQTLLSLLLRPRLFTYVTCWAAHAIFNGNSENFTSCHEAKYTRVG